MLLGVKIFVMGFASMHFFPNPVYQSYYFMCVFILFTFSVITDSSFCVYLLFIFLFELSYLYSLIKTSFLCPFGLIKIFHLFTPLVSFSPINTTCLSHLDSIIFVCLFVFFIFTVVPLKMHVCMLSCFSRVWLFATSWTVALKPPMSMELSWC